MRLWVRDEGPGVRQEDAERIFGRFVRGGSGPGAGPSPETGIEGSGLGLAIVRAIAEAHLGRVEVAPAHPHGAVFTIVLPVRHRAGDVEGDPTDLPAAPAGVQGHTAPASVAQEVAP